MIIRFGSKPTSNGWRWQVEIDTEKKQYKHGAFLFHYADVNDLTKKQFNELLEALDNGGFQKIN